MPPIAIAAASPTARVSVATAMITNISQPTVSHHLKVLLQAGLVEREQRGSWAYFRVREEPLAVLRALLT